VVELSNKVKRQVDEDEKTIAEAVATLKDCSTLMRTQFRFSKNGKSFTTPFTFDVATSIETRSLMLQAETNVQQSM